MLDRQRDGLAVDVFDRRHGVGNWIGAGAERDRERHGGEHVGGVVFLVEGLVADHRPAGGLDHLHVEALLAVEAEWMRHDDRSGAGDWNKADDQIRLLERHALGKYFRRGLEREQLRQCRQRGRGADRFEEGAASGVLRKDRAHHGRRNDPFVALLRALTGDALQPRLRRLIAVVRGLAGVATARAP